MSGSGDSFKSRGPRPSSPAAKARLAAALKENLQRRKVQARRQEQDAPQAEDAPPVDSPAEGEAG